MLVMVQQEVAQRLVAGPGSKAYGAVSVKVAYWAEASLVGTVPSSVFVPRPRVGSALVSLRRRKTPAVDPAVVAPAELFSLVRTGFAQRRKMLRRALADLGIPASAFVQAGINEESRAEELSVADWGRLAAAAGLGRLGAAVAASRCSERTVLDRRPRAACGRGDRTRQIDPVVARHRRATGRLPPPRCRDGHGRPCRHAVLLGR